MALSKLADYFAMPGLEGFGGWVQFAEPSSLSIPGFASGHRLPARAARSWSLHPTFSRWD